MDLDLPTPKGNLMNNLTTIARDTAAGHHRTFEAPSKPLTPIPETIPESCRGVPFMTSLEIAEMTGKRHADVMRDIGRELAKIGEDERKFASVYLGGNGERRPCFTLPGEYLLFIASAYDAKLRMQIIRHWSALNNGTAQPVKDAANVFADRLIAGTKEERRLRYQQDMEQARLIRDPTARRLAMSFAGKP